MLTEVGLSKYMLLKDPHQFSGGQRQGIAIARALSMKPKLIIFDEPTSALDEQIESEVMDTIYEISSELTVIIIAHRKSTLKRCNKIIEIKNSKIYQDNF